MRRLSDIFSAVKGFITRDPENQSVVAAAVKKLGVRDPQNPSAGDFKVVLDAYLKDKSLNTQIFTTYVKSLSAPLKAMFDGFTQFSADTGEVSKRALGVIERAMGIIQEELNREGISENERREALERVLHLVAEARDESKQDRAFKSRLAHGMLATVAIFAGVLIMVVTLGKYPHLATKGFELAAKAFGKAAA